MEYDMSKFGSNITSEHLTKKIVEDILKLLSSNEEELNLDFNNIALMTTSAAKAVLKPIVEKYGIQNFFKRIRFCNVADDLKIVISIAIDSF